MLNESLKVIFMKEVVDVTSIAFAQKLVEKFRGGRIYVPCKMPHEKHELRQAFSPEELEVLIDNFGGNQIDVPLSLTNRAAERRRIILDMRSKNMRICDIHKSANCTYRWVQATLKKERERQKAEENQLNLFNDERKKQSKY